MKRKLLVTIHKSRGHTTSREKRAHWKALGLIRKPREKGKLWARAFIVVSLERNR